jgi:uncharacterized protein
LIDFSWNTGIKKKVRGGNGTMDIAKKIASELNIKKWQVDATIELIDEGNTIPFISRYRKEITGQLDDEQLRGLSERLQYLRSLEEKKEQVIHTIVEQGNMTEELRLQIREANTLVAVEDLYRPYRPKRKTRASMAKEKGLEMLANYIVAQEAKEPIEKEAEKYVNPDKGVQDSKDAIQGAKDILAERISDEAQYRRYIRQETMQQGMLVSECKTKEQESVYEMYYAYEEAVKKIAPHRILAINRGEKEKILSVKIVAPVEQIIQFLEKQVIVKENKYTTPVLQEVISDSYQRLIAQAIERDIRNELSEKAEDGAIRVFGKNLEQLLMQPPIAGKTVLGWDPAFRTGCKLAVVDATGKVLDTKVIYPTAPQNKIAEAKEIVKGFIDTYGVSIISVGNGTASRESEQVIVSLIKELKKPVSYVIVNEAGASVYSASKLATEEFPNYDVGQRSAASIARRLQDPLAELVKIEPQAIGVGQYQHDMNQKKLKEALSAVVEDSVNKVGVDLNTASAPLLEYISGISKTIAKNIVNYREKNGRFKNRKELLKVEKLGPKAYEQCAGFMRIVDGDNPLDATSVHPEAYEATMKLLEKLQLTINDISVMQKESGLQKDKMQGQHAKKKPAEKKMVVNQTNTAMGKAMAAALKNEKVTVDSLANKGLNEEVTNAVSGISKRIKNKNQVANELGIGEITLQDILQELEKPARDPREDMPAPILRSDIMEMKDLKPGMLLKGTVRNVIDFGAFVDIGVHQDGLVHISELTNRYIKHPLEVVKIGDVVDVKILSVDETKKRIALTIKNAK